MLVDQTSSSRLLGGSPRIVHKYVNWDALYVLSYDSFEMTFISSEIESSYLIL